MDDAEINKESKKSKAKKNIFRRREREKKEHLQFCGQCVLYVEKQIDDASCKQTGGSSGFTMIIQARIMMKEKHRTLKVHLLKLRKVRFFVIL